MKTIELIGQTQEIIKRYYFDVSIVRKITVTEYLNDSGKVIDTIVEEEGGYDVEPELQEQLLTIIDTL